MRLVFLIIGVLFISLSLQGQGEVGLFTRDGEPFLYPYENIKRVFQRIDGTADLITVHPEIRGPVDENFHDVVANSCNHLFTITTISGDTLALNPRYIDHAGINSDGVTYIIAQDENTRYRVQNDIITLANTLSSCDSAGVGGSGGDGYLISGQLLGDSIAQFVVAGQDTVDVDIQILALDTQNLTWVENTRELSIDRGNTVTIGDKVNDADSVIGNEFQELDLLDGYLYITDGDSVNLNPFYDNTDSQILVYDSTTQLLTISGGNSVTLNVDGGDNWGSQVILSDTTLTGTGIISDILRVDTNLIATRSYVDSNTIPNTDDQELFWNDNLRQLTIENGNTVTIPAGSFGDDWGSQVVISDYTLLGDGTAVNPLKIDTTIIPTFNDISDDQTLNWNSGTGELSIENGNTVMLNLSDSGDNWGNQVVVSDTTIQGTGVSADPLSIDSTIVAYVTYVDSLFANAPDSQSLIWNEPNHELTIRRGNTINIPDNQELSWNDNLRELTIEDGNTVNIPTGADDWGDQVAQTDQTIIGNGLIASPLKVDTNNLIATKWDLTQIFGGSDNIYNTDDTLINNRTVEMLNRDLKFDKVGSFTVESDYVTNDYGHKLEVVESSVGDELDFIFWGNDQWGGNTPNNTSNSQFLVSVDEMSFLGDDYIVTLDGDFELNTDLGTDGTHGKLRLQIPGHEAADSDSSFVLAKVDASGSAIWKDVGTIVEGDDWGDQVALTEHPIIGDGSGTPIGLDTAWLDTSGIGDDWGDQVVQSDNSLIGTGIIGDLLSIDTNWLKQFIDTTVDGDNWGSQVAETEHPIIGDGTIGSPIGLDTAWLDTSGIGDDWGDQVAQTVLPIIGDGTSGNPLGLDTSWLDTSGIGDDWGDQVVVSDNTLSGLGIVGDPLSVDTSFLDSIVVPFDLQGLNEDEVLFGHVDGGLEQASNFVWKDFYLGVGESFDETRIFEGGISFHTPSGSPEKGGIDFRVDNTVHAEFAVDMSGSTVEDLYIDNAYSPDASGSIINFDITDENVGIGGVAEPTRKLDINGETRIRDLETTQATVLVAADADGVLSDLILGPGIEISNDSIIVTGGGNGVDSLAENQILFGHADGSIEQSPSLDYTDGKIVRINPGKLRIVQETNVENNNLEIRSDDNTTVVRSGNGSIGDGGFLDIFRDDNANIEHHLVAEVPSYLSLSNDLGIGTNSPTRKLDVDGEARIRDLTTTQATKIIGTDATGVLSDLIAGDGLTISNDTLIATGAGTDDQILSIEDNIFGGAYEESNYEVTIENGNFITLPNPHLSYNRGSNTLSLIYGSAGDQVDLDTVPFGVDTSIYSHDGILDSTRNVDFGTNELTFSNIGAFNLQVPEYNTTNSDSSMVLAKTDNNGKSVWKDIDEIVTGSGIDSLSENQVLFGHADGSIEQTPDFVWDDNNNFTINPGKIQVHQSGAGIVSQIEVIDNSGNSLVQLGAGATNEDGNLKLLDAVGNVQTFIAANAESYLGKNHDVGINVEDPTRQLDVNGDMRIRNLSPSLTTTELIGSNADGVLRNISVGSGLTLAGNELSASGGNAADSCLTLYKTGATIDLERHSYVYAEHTFNSSTSVSFTNPMNKSGYAGVYNIRLVNNGGGPVDVSLSGFTFYEEDGTQFSTYTVPGGEARVITFAVPGGTTDAYTME